MSRSDRAALIISLAVFLAGLYVSLNVLEGIPHIEDEFAFAWQAKVIAHGQLSTASPKPDPASFRVPFVVDFQGRRFAKYPPGWPVVLAAGEILPIRPVINPLLTCLTFWLIYRLTKKILDEKTALLAIGLGFTSPFVWMNSGSLLSHSWTLFLSTVFMLAWLDAFTEQNPSLPPGLARSIPCIAAALALGLLALSRPWTAIAIAFPFAFPSFYILFKDNPKARWRLAAFGFITGGIAAFYILWQFAVTGHPWLNPYTLWWPYDRVGFGPGIGLQPGGYSLYFALHNTIEGLYSANIDLFGWPLISWLLIPFGIIACWRNRRAWLVNLTLISIITAYAFYWIPSWITGPRYYYEALPAALLLSGAGGRWLAGSQIATWRHSEWKPFGSYRFTLTVLIMVLLVTANLVYYLPQRLESLRSLYGVSAKCTAPLKDLESSANPILIFVHLQKDFLEYSCISEQNSPFLDSKMLIAVSRGPKIDEAVSEAYPNRDVFHYYVDSTQFTRAPREETPY